jgi:DedD protein
MPLRFSPQRISQHIMAFFKFRRGEASSAPVAVSVPVESVEVVRKRARHRLIGATVLVALGVVGFPMLFDTQPRPVPVDIPIEIPSKNNVRPLSAPGLADKTKGVASPAFKVETAALKDSAAPAVAAAPAPAPAPKKDAKPEQKAQAKPAPPAPKPEPKPEAKPLLRKPDAATASAAAAPPPKPAADAKGRIVVQVGAFSDATKADEVRAKLEKAGLKTYTQITETKEGQRIRVRVGPFTSKTDAEKAGGKIKALDLPAAVLTL